MKFKLFTILLLFLGLSFNANAVNTITVTTGIESLETSDNTSFWKTKKNKFQRFLIKKAIKLNKWVKSNAVDLSDDVQKWLWYGIGLWILAVVLQILGYFVPFVWYIGYLAGVAGSFCVLYWLYLKFIKDA